MAGSRRIEGSCRCGRLSFAVTGDPLMVYACHCRDCQKMASSAFSLSALFPGDQFEHLGGATEIGGAHGEHRQHHCSWCKGWAYTQIAGPDGMISIRPALLDEPDAFPVLYDMMVEEALPGACSGAERVVPRNYEALARMTADYAAFLAVRRSARQPA
jgi:hypothetical protein